MDLNPFVPLFTALIAFCAFFALLSGVIKMFLFPIERDIKSLKDGQNDLKTELKNHIAETNKKFEENDKTFRSFGNLLREIKEITQKRLEKS